MAKHRKPRKHLPDDRWETQYARAVADMIMECNIERIDHPKARQLEWKTWEEWKVFVADTHTGRCSKRYRTITVPKWIFDSPEKSQALINLGIADDVHWSEFLLYYLAHEMAHTVSGDIHGPSFMNEFRMMCPEHLQRFELGYKPRNAALAGVSNK